MPSIEVLFAFLVAAGIFAYMPGPSTLYASAQTVARGRRAGLFAALGIHFGGYVHVIASSLGLAILFETVPAMYLALKLAGAAYLIWVGIRMFVAKDGTENHGCVVGNKSAKLAFWESVTVEVLNPKTAMFYVAFLPQFVDPTATFAIWVQLLILGTTVNILSSSAEVLCVVLAEKVTKILNSSGNAKRIARRVGGGILITLGVNLALDRR